MSLNPLPPGTPGPATIARIGFELAGAINRAIGGGISRADKERLEAGRAQGYRQTRQGWVSPEGTRVTQQTVIERGRIVLANQPGGYRPDLTETPADKKPPTVEKRPRTPTTPRIPGRAGRIVEGIATVAGGTGLFEAIRGGIRVISERDVAPPAPRPAPPLPPPAAASPNEVIGGRSPFYAPPTVKRPPPAPIPRAAAPAPVPQPAAPSPIETERLSPIDVYVPYAAIPAAPSPPPAVSTAPRSILGMSPAQLAGLAVPTLLALLAGSGSSSRRRRDPLTVPQTPTIPGGGTFPGIGLTPGGGLTPGSFPLPFPGGGFGGGGGGTDSLTDQCRELARRKRKPKQKRTVCYSGTFIERASGLSKQRKRKIQCR